MNEDWTNRWVKCLDTQNIIELHLTSGKYYQVLHEFDTTGICVVNDLGENSGALYKGRFEVDDIVFAEQLIKQEIGLT